MAKRYLVTLSEDARATLLTLTKQGSVAARKLIRACSVENLCSPAYIQG
jgi:hypothetical protein